MGGLAVLWLKLKRSRIFGLIPFYIITEHCFIVALYTTLSTNRAHLNSKAGFHLLSLGVEVLGCIVLSGCLAVYAAEL